MKVAKWRGGGPGDVGFDYSKYDDASFIVRRTNGKIEDGWKFVVPHSFNPMVNGIRLTKDDKYKTVPYEDLMEYNDWFK
jgi:hypothetical protein